MKDLIKEIPIANHEFYSINSNGEIYSYKLGKKLKPVKQKNGYLLIILDGKGLLVHRLVAKHFIPNPYDYSQVNHKDGNKENNNVNNLEWVSPQQNIQHALKIGTRKGFVHINVIRQMLSRWLNGETAKDLAKEVGNHPNTLNRMMKRQAFKDGLLKEWNIEVKRKRAIIAKANLEKINVRNKR